VCVCVWGGGFLTVITVIHGSSLVSSEVKMETYRHTTKFNLIFLK
jgi:hypothetical protein